MELQDPLRTVASSLMLLFLALTWALKTSRSLPSLASFWLPRTQVSEGSPPVLVVPGVRHEVQDAGVFSPSELTSLLQCASLGTCLES